ncbi:MAG: hypothetical protein RLZZ535_1598 [Cyanobacteriota bacterium]|jgi:hypothetical protein
MYYPYFRGKQYDLIAIRENAELFAKSKFIPIIEPVKAVLSGLKRALTDLDDAGAELVLIVNPVNGDHCTNPDPIFQLLKTDLENHSNISPGILLTENMTADEVISICSINGSRLVTLIHAGFTDARMLASKLGTEATKVRHVFFEQHCGKLYRKHFDGSTRVLLRDGFKRQTANRLYSDQAEFFSDLHVTYQDENMQGFGDFLTVGDEYSETGGPAYSVAIHLTFIDEENDNVMFVHHFKSDRNDTPTDPAGKFAEALKKLFLEVTSPNTKVFRSNAVNEFIDLHNRGHFPGLGHVKKLSMNHHIETLAHYFA